MPMATLAGKAVTANGLGLMRMSSGLGEVIVFFRTLLTGQD